MRRRVSISAMLALLTALTVLPGLVQASPPPPQAQYFKETGHAAHNYYWQFWKNTPDALRILGYPTSEPFNQESFTEPGKFYRVQYFERAVLEEHPENFGRDNNQFYVLGRLLGTELVKNRLNEAPFQEVDDIARNANQTWFPETGHTLRNDAERGPFKQFWEQYGGLLVFGFPLSEPFQEKNADTGQTYWVQYFERNRFEFHPEQTDPVFRVLLGRLGVQYAANNPDKVDAGAFAARSPAESLPEPFIYGSNATLYYTDANRVLTLAKTAFETNYLPQGPTWIRQQVPWQDHMNCDGTIAWGELDKVFAAAKEQNVKVLAAVVRSPSCFTSRPQDQSQHGMPSRESFGRFAQFLGSLTERYRGTLGAVEVWNEQNYAIENAGTVAAPAFYVDLLEAGYKAIKAVDRNVIVVSGSPTATETNKSDVALNELRYFEAMFGNPKFWENTDVVGVHPNNSLNAPDASPEPNRPIRNQCDTWNTNSEFYFKRLEQIRDLMVRAGRGDRQVWITESGWATENTSPGYEYGNCVTLDEQAVYIKRSIELARFDYAPWVGAYFIWNLNFAVTWGTVGNPKHEQAAYGILNPDWSPRPAFVEVQKMVKP